jgi:hypothetical protein
VHAQDLVELLANLAHRVERVERTLHDDRDVGPPHATDLIVRGGQDVEGSGRLAVTQVQGDLATGDHARQAQQTGETEDQGRLARPTLTCDPEDFGALQGEGDVGDGAHGVVAEAVVDVEVADLENGSRLAVHDCPFTWELVVRTTGV